MTTSKAIIGTFLLVALALMGGPHPVALADLEVLPEQYAEWDEGEGGTGSITPDCRWGDENYENPCCRCFLPVQPPNGGGSPRTWESGVGVSTYGLVNLANGNLHLTVPVVPAIPGRGPSLSLTLFYNSAFANEGAGVPGYRPELGPSWRHTFMTHIFSTGGFNNIMLVEADGTKKRLSVTGQSQDAGVYEQLSWHTDGPLGWYELKRPDQSVWVFDVRGFLMEVRDTADSRNGGTLANVLRIERNPPEHHFPHRITKVIDANGRELRFYYTPNGERLDHVEMSLGGSRRWDFWYWQDPRGRLAGISDAMWDWDPTHGHLNYFDYDFETGYLTREVNKNRINDYFVSANRSNRSHAFDFEYDEDGRVVKVTDPADVAPSGQDPYERTFAYGEAPNGGDRTVFTDRRSGQWTYDFEVLPPIGRLTRRLVSAQNPIDGISTFTYDASNNLVQRTNAFGRHWDYTYDAQGNLTSSTDPNGHHTNSVYDWYNNLITFTDAAGFVTGYRYDDPNDQTLVTAVRELYDGASETWYAETTRAYYGPSDSTSQGLPDLAWNGLPKNVIDANGVETRFEHEIYGVANLLREGPEEAGVENSAEFDDAGRATGSMSAYGEGGAQYDDNDNPIVVGCGPLDSAPLMPLSVNDPGNIIPLMNFPSAWRNKFSSGCGSFLYTPMDQPWEMQGCVNAYWSAEPNIPDEENVDRVQTYDYDGLGAPKTRDLMTEESGNEVERGFLYVTDYVAGTTTRWGPDGVWTKSQLDLAGRPLWIETRRGGSGGPTQSRVDYSYDAIGRMETAAYGNGTQTDYSYDTADRLTSIHHRVSGSGPTLLRLDYEYVDDAENPDRIINGRVDGRGLIWRVTETDGNGVTATVTYRYDGLSRLVHEKREDSAGTNPVEYELSYAYDKLGNRLRKVDHGKALTTVYHYDVHEEPTNPNDPDPFAAHNNRLQWYDVYAGEHACTEPDPLTCGEPAGTLLERVMYIYDTGGNPELIVHYRPHSENACFLVRFTYDTGGRVWLMEQWTYQLEGTAPNQTVVAGSAHRVGFREFRYDGGGRARYLVREREPDLEAYNAGAVLSETWTDYDGESPYADYALAGQYVEERTSWLPGVASSDVLSQTTRYVLPDQVGTMLGSTNPAGAVEARAVRTAFGEMVWAGGDIETLNRYGYVGAHGYEEGLLGDWGEGWIIGDPTTQFNNRAPALSYVHVGARWYDPSTGRFLQRDPIGIAGGLNIYLYVKGSPVYLIDPYGERWYNPFDYEPVARLTLALTGGDRNTYLDRVGNNVGARKSLDEHIIDWHVAGGAWRVMKKGDGVASTMSAFERYHIRKALRITIRQGMRIGRFCGAIAVVDGAFRGYQVVDAAIEEW